MPRWKEMRGVYSIPVTPFDERGAVDYASLRSCVEFCIEAGADGIVMPVMASEAPTLTDVERVKVISTGVKATAGAVPSRRTIPSNLRSTPPMPGPTPL